MFGGIELRLDGRHDGFGDLVLNREHIGYVPIITLGPDMAAGRDIVELSGDAHLVAALADTAFDHVPGAEFLSHLLDMDGLALVDERRVTRDDEKPSQLR